MRIDVPLFSTLMDLIPRFRYTMNIEAAGIADTVRRAAIGRASAKNLDNDWILQWVRGRGENLNDRVSYIPIPSLDIDERDGNIRRILLLCPNADNLKIVANLIDKHWLYGGLSIRRSIINPEDLLYFATSRSWITVLPAVLPGFKEDECTKALFRTLKFAGIEESKVINFRLTEVPLIQHSFAPLDYWFPRQFYKRPCKLHISIEFSEDLTGPLILGCARHYGMGLMIPKGIL
jgi:CRISPR-associated protein Csb2